MSKVSFFVLTADKALGAAGCGLAAASLSFGVYMNIHGPVEGFGKSKDFTVFAQLAPKRARSEPTHGEPTHGEPTHGEPAAAPDGALDMTATASIPKPSSPAVAARPNWETAIIPSITLEAVNADQATISIDGRPETVRIGDLIPGVGEVLEIRRGRRAVVRTSRGLILPAQGD